MGAGYVKLFEQILDSTIWREAKETKLLWITMLAMKGRDSRVMASIPGLADRARLTLEETESSLKVLLSPDKYSRTKDNEGRRIAEIDGGWVVLNGDKYRDMLSLEDRRDYQRRKQAEYRKRKKDLRCQAKGEGAVQAINEGFKSQGYVQPTSLDGSDSVLHDHPSPTTPTPLQNPSV